MEGSNLVLYVINILNKKHVSLGESENEIMMVTKRAMANAESVEMSGRAVSYMAADPRVIKKTAPLTTREFLIGQNLFAR